VTTLLAGFFLLLVKRTRNLVLITIGAVVVAGLIVSSIDYAFQNVLQAHQRSRINVLLGKNVDIKGAGYNVQQSKIAIGSGGLWGKGPLQGTQNKFRFVPEQSTDFIFCTIGEEYGFAGSVIFICLYMFLLYRLLLMAERQRQKFNRIYGYSVVCILFFHFLINVGMTLGVMPVIGIPLPFISYGGSALLSFTILLFIFIRLDANRVNELRTAFD
jgi:rod shape determining protein RodA